MESDQAFDPAPALLGPSAVRRLLATHGLAPARRLGQNFVVDANTVRKTVRDAGVGPGDIVLEVGPGLGSLTRGLRAVGAQVVALEVDAGMVRALGEVVGADPGVQVVHGDALEADLAGLVADAGVPKFVANLPYNIAVPVVMRALATERFTHLHVMVQREAGERMAATRGHPAYGGVSVKVASWAEARVAASVPRTAFWPVPNVDSVTVALTPRPWSAPVGRAALASVVDAGFGQRRKRLRNALAVDGRRPADVERALAAANLDVGARAEELDLPAWITLAACLLG